MLVMYFYDHWKILYVNLDPRINLPSHGSSRAITFMMEAAIVSAVDVLKSLEVCVYRYI